MIEGDSEDEVDNADNQGSGSQDDTGEADPVQQKSPETAEIAL